MSQSFAQVYLHCIFSTKHREPLITSEIEDELYTYLGGLIKELKGIPLEINGAEDHIHIVSTLPRTITIAHFLEVIKANSSRWIKKFGPDFFRFSWQKGYAAFSVSMSKLKVVCKYVKDQKEHHKKITFKEELLMFLKEYGAEYDERYLWD